MTPGPRAAVTRRNHLLAGGGVSEGGSGGGEDIGEETATDKPWSFSNQTPVTWVEQISPATHATTADGGSRADFRASVKHLYFGSGGRPAARVGVTTLAGPAPKAAGKSIVCSDIEGYRQGATARGSVLVPPRAASLAAV